MKNRKGIMALEGLEAQEPELIEAPLDETTPLEIDNEVQGLDEQFDQLDEAEGIAETVDTITDGLEETIQDVTAEDGTVTPGEGVDELTAEVTNATLEHFYNRVGIQRKAGQKTVSLEGFGVAKTRLKNTQVAIENLKVFQKKLAASIQVAQEGLLDSISNRIDSSSTQLDGILGALSQVSKDFDAKGVKEGAVDGGKWAAPFGYFDSEMVMSKDVVARLKEVDTAFKKSQATQVIKEMGQVVDQITSEMSKEKGEVDSHDSLGKKLDQLNAGVEAIRSITKAKAGNSAGADAFVAISAEDKTALLALVKSIGNELSSFSTAWAQLEEKIKYLKAAADKAESSKATPGTDGAKPIKGRIYGAILGSLVFGVGAFVGFLVGWAIDTSRQKPGADGKQEAAHKGQAGQTKNQTRSNLQAIVEIDAELVKLCYAAVTYVEKSTA